MYKQDYEFLKHRYVARSDSGTLKALKYHMPHHTNAFRALVYY